jgi:hypothetical protein
LFMVFVNVTSADLCSLSLTTGAPASSIGTTVGTAKNYHLGTTPSVYKYKMF